MISQEATINHTISRNFVRGNCHLVCISLLEWALVRIQLPEKSIPTNSNTSLSSDFFSNFFLLTKKLQNDSRMWSVFLRYEAKLGQEIKLNSWWSWVRFWLTSLNMRCPISAKYVMVSCADSAGMISWTLDISSDRKRSIRTIIKKIPLPELNYNEIFFASWIDYNKQRMLLLLLLDL